MSKLVGSVFQRAEGAVLTYLYVDVLDNWVNINANDLGYFNGLYVCHCNSVENLKKSERQVYFV